ncbi:MAG: hypothetical protein KA327_06825 [Pseudarcicella sp.]|nr:hypothetical protein [Pseudarcicella sp.]
MNPFPFEVNSSLLEENRITLSDTIRMALYREDEVVFETLDYDNDFAFMEPALFCYFLSDIPKEKKISLQQILLGYMLPEKKPEKILLQSDKWGYVNLPNMGYLKTEPEANFVMNLSEIKDNLLLNVYVDNTNIRVCQHPTDLLSNAIDIVFDECVADTYFKNKTALNTAVDFFQKYLSDLWGIIQAETREFVVFSSPNHNSFAGIKHQGTGYFNTENRMVSPIFFIEDIAHQCGHVVYNVLTLQTEQYLKHPKDFPLQNFTSDPSEARGIYGAFHGLFTYTTITHALSNLIKLPIFSDLHILEAKARLGFFMQKFQSDLALMTNPQILTDEGMRFCEKFNLIYLAVWSENQTLFKNYTYRNQNYIFDFQIFIEENNCMELSK